MKHFVRNIEIENFKSIKHLKADCKRVNVFIGKPNVGKSNILEAISLLGAVSYSRDSQKALQEYIRYEEISNLFYDDDVSKTIYVRVGENLMAAIKYQRNAIDAADILIGSVDFVEGELQKNHFQQEIITEHNPREVEEGVQNLHRRIFPNGSFSERDYSLVIATQNPVRKYAFGPAKHYSNKFPFYLLPPHGDNLFTIVDHNSSLRKEIAAIFQEYGLQFVAYKKESKFEIEKNIDGYVTKFHYSSMADTFQRLIFYFAVIDSNKDAVLILEEPEVHSFPPYTKMLAERIVASTDNQFFLTTHSPYLLQSLVSELDASQLNVFVTYFEQYETKVRALSAAELRRVSEYGIDLFFNLDQFIE